MRATTTAFLFMACGGALAVSACNSILDNTSATLEVDAGDAAGPAEGSDDSGSIDATIAVDASTPDANVHVETGDASACGAGQKSCEGSCVSITDPAYGCSATSCDSCSIARGTATCAGASCGVSACDPGYADCDSNAANGCETDLSQATTCGTCNSACAAAAPNCAPVGASFQCTTGCSASAPTLCGNECADLSDSVDHCGDCNNACAAVAHATVQCQASACTFTCKAGMANCDGVASNGCESVLATDPQNCGACGKVCPGTACSGGVCAAPPPPKDAGTTPTDSGTAPSDSGTTGSSDAATD